MNPQQSASLHLDTNLKSFELDSLGATGLALALEKKLGLRIRSEDVYEFSTIRRLAAHVEGLGQTRTFETTVATRIDYINFQDRSDLGADRWEEK